MSPVPSPPRRVYVDEFLNLPELPPLLPERMGSTITGFRKAAEQASPAAGCRSHCSAVPQAASSPYPTSRGMQVSAWMRPPQIPHALKQHTPRPS